MSEPTLVTREHLELLAETLRELPDGTTFYPSEPDVERFGIAYAPLTDELIGVGDVDVPFPQHSISKVFTYAVALEDNGRSETEARVGAEPSGEAFNAISFDERNHRPFNAMINSGALVAANLVHGTTVEEKVGRVLERLRVYAGNADLETDEAILSYELDHNDRNLGLSYLMRSLDMLEGDVEDNLRVYLSLCSIKVTTRDLAVMGATLANGGVNPYTGGRALARQFVRDIITVMTTCGMYDVAGQWAYDIGIPAKSGVGGGIVAAMPERFGLGLFSPGLDEYGHSVRGVETCRELSTHYGLHIFDEYNRLTPQRIPATTES